MCLEIENGWKYKEQGVSTTQNDTKYHKFFRKQTIAIRNAERAKKNHQEERSTE